jgi:GntR family transcriptional regulator
MLIVVDPHSGVPVYRQLMDQIKFHIASGLMLAGEELPSTRALSGELGVNPMTISKAYSYLEREGVIERRPGRPLVVRAVESDAAQQRKLDQLRESLTAAATMARQLGIDPGQALQIYESMLTEPGADATPAASGATAGDASCGTADDTAGEPTE